MKVFVTGATGVLGAATCRALRADGHQVAGLARTADKARQLEVIDVEPVVMSIFDSEALAGAFAGFEVVCNLASHRPTGLAALRPGAWRVNDRIRTEASRAVASAAVAAGVHRLVQDSVSVIYADGGDEWITEDSPIMVTRALDPVAVAETTATGFGNGARDVIVLRFGVLTGEDPATHWMLDRAAAGKAIGVGEPTGWAHLVHVEDAGKAVASALHAPSGVYNVGADPIRKSDLVRQVAAAVGRDGVGFLPKVVVRVAGERLEPATRSLRVSSARLHTATGWKPTHGTFGPEWLPHVPPQPRPDVFGDVLPGSTRDDWAEPGSNEGFTAEDYRRERPPHY